MSNTSEDAQQNAREYSLQLILALNAIATSLQESIRGEKNIHDVFQRQVVALGLRGGISYPPLMDLKWELPDRSFFDILAV